MSTIASQSIVVRNFSAAFEQMCNIVAVSNAGDRQSTIDGLIQVVLLRFEDDRLSTAQAISDTMNSIFGVHVPQHQITPRLAALEDQNCIFFAPDSYYTLCPKARDFLQKKIDQATQLEDRVKATWLDGVGLTEPELDPRAAWTALKRYLAAAFRRHGMQAAALLDPQIETPLYTESLSQILTESITASFGVDQHDSAKRALTSFFVNPTLDLERTQFIVQLADSAFSFYVLEIPPDVAERFRAGLSPLTLFLDTNFLFGILGLHHNSQVDVSLELIRAIDKHKLPIRLRFHEATDTEMRGTIAYYGNQLRAHKWRPALSRAAAKTRNLTGIELHYHEQNARAALTADDFLKPYIHFDVLLDAHNIKIYRPTSPRLEERSALYHEYKAFLDGRGKGDKSYETVQHDATLLDAVRAQRSKARSSLEASALLVTCDYFLYRFDWETARTSGGLVSVVLPSAFWQLLRPYVPSDGDFDRSFAETFSLPEFRALGSGGGRACSRMMSVLSGMGDVPEQTAERLLANDALLDRLRTITDEGVFVEEIESAIIHENAQLLEEKAAKEVELARKNAELELVRDQLREHKSTLDSVEQQTTELRDRLEASSIELHNTKSAAASESERIRSLAEEVKKLRSRAAELEVERKQEASEKRAVARQAHYVRIGLAALSAVVLTAVFLGVVHLAPWGALQNHPNGTAIQAAACVALVLGVIGLLFPATRKWTWSVSGLGVGGLIVLILSKL